MPFFVSIGKTRGNQRSRNTSKKTVPRNKLYIYHCRKHKGNRKLPHYHCRMCGKPVLKFNMKHHYSTCANKEMKEVRHQKEKYSKAAVCAKKLLGHHNENYDKSVTEDNQHGPVYNIHKAKNCLIITNVSFGNESRLQQGNMFKTTDESETGREDASDKLKGFTENITRNNNIKKHSNKSTYKKADNEEIRMRGKDLQEKEDMEETLNFNKRSINEVLTSTPHIVTQEEPQTESYRAEDMNI